MERSRGTAAAVPHRTRRCQSVIIIAPGEDDNPFHSDAVNSRKRDKDDAFDRFKAKPRCGMPESVAIASVVEKGGSVPSPCGADVPKESQPTTPVGPQTSLPQGDASATAPPANVLSRRRVTEGSLIMSQPSLEAPLSTATPPPRGRIEGVAEAAGIPVTPPPHNAVLDTSGWATIRRRENGTALRMASVNKWGDASGTGTAHNGVSAATSVPPSKMIPRRTTRRLSTNSAPSLGDASTTPLLPTLNPISSGAAGQPHSSSTAAAPSATTVENGRDLKMQQARRSIGNVRLHPSLLPPRRVRASNTTPEHPLDAMEPQQPLTASWPVLTPTATAAPPSGGAQDECSSSYPGQGSTGSPLTALRRCAAISPPARSLSPLTSPVRQDKELAENGEGNWTPATPKKKGVASPDSPTDSPASPIPGAPRAPLASSLMSVQNCSLMIDEAEHGSVLLPDTDVFSSSLTAATAVRPARSVSPVANALTVLRTLRPKPNDSFESNNGDGEGEKRGADVSLLRGCVPQSATRHDQGPLSPTYSVAGAGISFTSDYSFASASRPAASSPQRRDRRPGSSSQQRLSTRTGVTGAFLIDSSERSLCDYDLSLDTPKASPSKDLRLAASPASPTRLPRRTRDVVVRAPSPASQRSLTSMSGNEHSSFSSHCYDPQEWASIAAGSTKDKVEHRNGTSIADTSAAGRGTGMPSAPASGNVQRGPPPPLRWSFEGWSTGDLSKGAPLANQQSPTAAPATSKAAPCQLPAKFSPFVSMNTATPTVDSVRWSVTTSLSLTDSLFSFAKVSEEQHSSTVKKLQRFFESSPEKKSSRKSNGNDNSSSGSRHHLVSDSKASWPSSAKQPSERTTIATRTDGRSSSVTFPAASKINSERGFNSSVMNSPSTSQYRRASAPAKVSADSTPADAATLSLCSPTHEERCVPAAVLSSEATLDAGEERARERAQEWDDDSEESADADAPLKRLNAKKRYLDAAPGRDSTEQAPYSSLQRSDPGFFLASFDDVNSTMDGVNMQ